MPDNSSVRQEYIHMYAVKLFPPDQEVRIVARRGREALGMSDKVLLEFIRLRQDAIWRRGEKLNRHCDTFSAAQGSDPFGPHSRVEIHVLISLVGKWRMRVYWSPDNSSWAGMHLQLNFRWEWPIPVMPYFEPSPNGASLRGFAAAQWLGV